MMLDEKAVKELAEKKRREAVEARTDAILKTFGITFSFLLGVMLIWILLGGQLP